MSSERAREIRRLFDAAASLAQGERSAFLSEACSDTELRKEVEELLAADEDSGVVLSELGRAAAALAETPVTEGQLLAGKYRVERVLGRGGFGVVVEATHVGLDERVAVKLLRADLLARAAVRTRFVREARLTAKLKSEHIARIHDVGTLQDGSIYLVMELLKGRDLHAVLQDKGTLGVVEAVSLVLQACEGLAAAHRAGIVHRDIKPGNLFLTERPDGSPLVKLLDFGISKQLEAADEALTSSSAFLGSPSYMSPEQLRAARDVDGRADIWSLGVVLYIALSGRLPFVAGSVADLCIDVLTKPYPPLLEVPDPVAQVIARCLEKDRTARFANLADLAHALAPHAGRLGLDSAERVARILGVEPQPVASKSAMASRDRSLRWLAVPVVAAGVVLVWWLWPAPSTAPAVTPSAAPPLSAQQASRPDEPPLRPPASGASASSATAAATASAAPPPASRGSARPAQPTRDPYAGRK